MDDQAQVTFGSVLTAILLLFVAATLMAVPLNLVEGRLPTPLLPLIVIFAYGLERPGSLPTVAVFAAGIYQDLLFGVGLGPFAMINLLVFGAILWQRSYFVGRELIVLTVGFSSVLLVAMMVFWILMSILGGRPMPLGGLFYQTLVTCGAFPIILMLMRRTVMTTKKVGLI